MRAFLALFVLVVACPSPGDDDSAVPDDDSTVGDDDDAPYLNVLESAADLAALGDGAAVKYLAPTAAWTREPPIQEDCYFQDMRRYPWHLQFLRSFEAFASLDPETYEAWVVQPESRIWWGGVVQLWSGALHPISGERGVLSFAVYSNGLDPQLTPAQIAEIWTTMKGCAPFAADQIAWGPDGSAQRAFAEAEAEGLAALGVPVVMPEDLVAGMPSTTWSAGEGYGMLKIVPAGLDLADYGPRDVVIVDQADNDMSLVSGLLTAFPQNLHSHINLRLQEKGIPSATVPDIRENSLITSLDGALVHLVAAEDGTVILEPGNLADAETFWKSRYPDLPPTVFDPTVTTLAPLTTLRHADALAYGAKAANLGELTVALPPEHRMDGFAVPFAAYLDHLASAGIESQIEEMLGDPRLLTDRAWKEGALDDLRDQIRDAPLDPLWWEALEAAVREAFPLAPETTRLRFRSSTNVEDLDELTGAGLYDSKSGCLGDDLDGDEFGPSLCLSAAQAAWTEAEITRWDAALAASPEDTWIVGIVADLEQDLVEERPLSLALRRVWGSLWNTRAFDERLWYGIDHRDAVMAVAVHPALWGEQAEAVVVTNLQGGPLPLYRVVSQAGELGVVRPIDPTAVAEVLTFTRDGELWGDVEILVESDHSEGPIWDDPSLAVLVPLIFDIQDHFGSVYPDLDPLRLDIEVDQNRDGNVVIKQVRPFVTYDPQGD